MKNIGPSKDTWENIGVGNIGKLTGAFDPNQTFNAAKKFDDEGSSGILGIGGGVVFVPLLTYLTKSEFNKLNIWFSMTTTTNRK